MIGTGRLEAFSDGVIAIIITIMVLEMKVPEGITLTALRPLLPVFLSYVLSFVYLGIYWNNHHHFLHVTQRVSGGVLWANLHLLFWLSLIPFVTGWMGENSFAEIPTAVYGGVLLMAAIAFRILQRAILAVEGRDSLLAAAVSHDVKGNLSPLLYVAAIIGALIQPWIAGALYVAVALLWLVPDRRIERAVAESGGGAKTSEEPGAAVDGQADVAAPGGGAGAATPATSSPSDYLERIAVESRGEIRVVPVAQIDYITADGPYAELHVAKQTHVIRERMKTLDRRFARIHRSTIVDCSGWRRWRLISTADYIVKLLDGTKLKVSRGRRPALAESLGVEF